MGTNNVEVWGSDYDGWSASIRVGDHHFVKGGVTRERALAALHTLLTGVRCDLATAIECVERKRGADAPS